MTATVYGDSYLARQASVEVVKNGVASGTPSIGNGGSLVALTSDGVISPDLITSITGAITPTSVVVGAGGVTFPSADPHVAGRWWDNAGTLTKSAG